MGTQLLMVTHKLFRNHLKNKWLSDLAAYFVQGQGQTPQSWISKAENSTGGDHSQFGRRCSYSEMPCGGARLGSNLM